MIFLLANSICQPVKASSLYCLSWIRLWSKRMLKKKLTMTFTQILLKLEEEKREQFPCRVKLLSTHNHSKNLCHNVTNTMFLPYCAPFFPPLTEPQQVVIVLFKCEPTHSIVHKAWLRILKSMKMSRLSYYTSIFRWLWCSS